MNDDQYYSDLAYARGKQREINEFESSTRRIVRPPSKLRYGFLYSLAITGDLVDLAELTGIGLILVWLVKLIVSPILFYAGVDANSRVKAMGRLQEEINKNIAQITRRVETYTRRYMTAIKFSRKTGILKKPVRKIALKVARGRKAILRNPLIKNALAGFADLIPIIDLLPWRTFGVFLMYRDEKSTFLEAMEALPDYISAKTEEIQAAEALTEAMLNEAEEQPA